MSDSEILVKVENVSKKFCRSLKRSMWYGMCDIAAELNPFGGKAEKLKSDHSGQVSGSQHSGVSAFQDVSISALQQSSLRSGEFWAVDNVSFELRRGECLGLIGRNGAGKTTLLRMLNGLIKPDRGRIEMRGRVGALISLGAGFNPILTGRENIYVNASILGLRSQEIDAKIEEIIDFADIREFIDSPVQSYSSGMQVRLGFAVATAIEPDVLILDEVLAVGDAAFRAQCYQRVGMLLDKSAVILVSHMMEQIKRAATFAILLDRGRVCSLGSTEQVAVRYQELTRESGDDLRAGRFLKLKETITRFEVSTPTLHIAHGEILSFELIIETTVPIRGRLRIQFYDISTTIIAETEDVTVVFPQPFTGKMALNLGPICMKPQIYSLSVILHSHNGIDILAWSYKMTTCRVEGCLSVTSDVVLRMNITETTSAGGLSL